AATVGTLRRDDGGADRFLAAVSQVHLAGADVDWRAVFAGTGARRVGLPTYAFQRQRHWLDVGSSQSDPSSGELATRDTSVGLLFRPGDPRVDAVTRTLTDGLHCRVTRALDAGTVSR